MSSKLNRYLEEINNKRKEVSLIRLEMNKVIEEYEESINHLKDKLFKCKEELLSLSSMILFKVRLGDLIYEISQLSGIDINDIVIKLETNVAFPGEHDFLSMFKMLDESRGSYFIRMELKSVNYDKDGRSFDYFAFLPLDFESIHNDGSKLVDHSSLIVKGAFDGIYTEIDIDKNIEDIILNFDISYLEMKDNASWYPADLFVQAIMNCVHKKENKVRERVM